MKKNRKDPKEVHHLASIVVLITKCNNNPPTKSQIEGLPENVSECLFLLVSTVEFLQRDFFATRFFKFWSVPPVSILIVSREYINQQVFIVALINLKFYAKAYVKATPSIGTAKERILCFDAGESSFSSMEESKSSSEKLDLMTNSTLSSLSILI